MKRNLLFSALLLLMVSACGFQLRGAVDLPARFQTMTLAANPNSDFTKALIDQLRANNVRIVEQAPITLTINDDDVEARTVSYSSRSKSAEKEILRRVTFSVADRQNNTTLIPSSELQARRTYLYDDNKVSAMQEQEALIRQELAFDLATRLMLKLQKY